MNKENEGKNLIISPLSIFQVLSLATNGANGDTHAEMLDVLQSEDISMLNQINYRILSVVKSLSTVEIANAVMTKFTPLQNFSDISKQYLAPVEPLESVEQVNNWCAKKTHGVIKKILDELNPNTLIILINAVYFKGEWVSKFKQTSTTKKIFYNLGENGKNVDTMRQISHFNYYEDKKVQAVQLKYKKDGMYALVILPNERNYINNYIRSFSLSNDEYNNILKGLHNSKVNLELPKFKLEFSQDIKQNLMDLGMYNAFSIKDADFNGLKEENGIFIEQVVHKTFLKVDEDGTEAAAVTAISGAGSAAPTEEKIYDMIVNRPFLFLLCNSNLPSGYEMLFMSKIETI